MASSKDYLQFVLEQLSELQEITYRAIADPGRYLNGMIEGEFEE